MSSVINKCIGFLLLTLLVCSDAIAQEPEQITINGTRYFVYPYRIKVTPHNAYIFLARSDQFFAFSLDQVSDKDVKFNTGMTKEMLASQFSEYESKIKELARITGFNQKKLIKRLRENPFELLEQEYTFDMDIIPPFEPLPDGKYVQLFEPFCMVDKQGNCSADSSSVAAFFNLRANMPDGFACWMNVKGDTLKKGNFKDGLKTGTWTLEQRDVMRNLTDYDTKAFLANGHFSTDTIQVVQEFEHGMRNGSFLYYRNSVYPIQSGSYTDDKPAGEWIYREIDFSDYALGRNDNHQITKRFTYADPKRDTLVSHQPWIRGRAEMPTSHYPLFEFDPLEMPNDPPGDMFKLIINDKSDSGDERNVTGDPTDELQNNSYFSESTRESYFSTLVEDPNKNGYLKRGQVIDSLGHRPSYTGIYEEFYTNGQRMMRYDFDKKTGLVEDTIFWDNGNSYDVIRFDIDSNHYVRSLYDYDGKLYRTMVYDSLGDFSHLAYEYDFTESRMLEGAKGIVMGGYIAYDNYGILNEPLSDSVTLFKSWNENDSIPMYQSTFDPVERMFYNTKFNVYEAPIGKTRIRFAEDYKSWTGVDTLALGKFKLITHTTAYLRYQDSVMDSLPQRYVADMYHRFDKASDYQYVHNGMPYTGDVRLNFNRKKMHVGDRELNVNFPQTSERLWRKLSREQAKYRTKGKISENVYLKNIGAGDTQNDPGQIVFYEFFSAPLQALFDYPSAYEFNDYEIRNGHSSRVIGAITKIEGEMVDGKPNGTWIGYDKKGNRMIEAPFINGLPDGKVNTFAYATVEEFEREDSLIYGSPPTKTTHHLAERIEFKQGLRDGLTERFNWNGLRTELNHYEGGVLHGKSEEVSKLAFTQLNYKDGAFHGYLSTYLTLPGADTMLIYQLNFQNGLLHGESKAFHTNGILAKRGFFMDGYPIEDYEVFDTLGRLTERIKFKYSYPVEEKKWEAGQLCLKYEFNWEDSVYFEPEDITFTQSLESLLYKWGILKSSGLEPYYGGPSLIDKAEIKYRVTRYNANDSIARTGAMHGESKTGCWKYYDYTGKLMYEVDYQKEVVSPNDSIVFKTLGRQLLFDSSGFEIAERYVIELEEKYDCTHADHYEIRQYYTLWDSTETQSWTNGHIRNYYDNGVLQSEGELKDGLPVGFWSFYDPYGKLNTCGEYVHGKRHGRWLHGDLAKKKYLGEICLNPNLPDLENEVKYRENLLNVEIINYKLGREINRQFYDVNMNRFSDSDSDTPNNSESGE